MAAPATLTRTDDLEQTEDVPNDCPGCGVTLRNCDDDEATTCDTYETTDTPLVCLYCHDTICHRRTCGT